MCVCVCCAVKKSVPQYEALMSDWDFNMFVHWSHISSLLECAGGYYRPVINQKPVGC